MKNLAILLAFVFAIAGAVAATSARAVEEKFPLRPLSARLLKTSRCLMPAGRNVR